MSEYRRFFAKNNDRIDDIVYISGNEYNHISKVLRMKIGDNAIVCVGDGKDLFCEIINFTKDVVQLKILEERINKSELPIAITLFQAAVKGDKMDFIIQKSVELGVDTIVPFQSAFAIAKVDEKTERYNKIALEACKQCGRATVVNVNQAMSFQNMLKSLDNYDIALFCNENEEYSTIHSILKTLKNESTMSVIVGSEGGFSKEEVEAIKEKAKSVLLCNRILRAETASVFALSVIVSQLEG
ncbi:MAG: RsmE family RNA methyltransferase [Clostridia bacterium]